MKTPHKCRVPGLNIGCTSFIIPDYYFNFELREEGETW